MWYINATPKEATKPYSFVLWASITTWPWPANVLCIKETVLVMDPFVIVRFLIWVNGSVYLSCLLIALAYDYMIWARCWCFFSHWFLYRKIRWTAFPITFVIITTISFRERATMLGDFSEVGYFELLNLRVKQILQI